MKKTKKVKKNNQKRDNVQSQVKTQEKRVLKRPLKDVLDDGGVLARFIIELQGGPREHIVSTMKMVVVSLKDSENVISVVENEVIEMPDQKEIFSTFSEFEIVFDDLQELIGFCFDYAPTSVEIIEPEKFLFEANVITDILNDFVSKIHQNAKSVRDINMQNKILQYNASAFLRNLLIIAMAQKDRPLDELSKITGVKEQDLEPILKQLVEKKEVDYKDKKYSLVKTKK
jgi:hypothetical protein